MNIALLQLNMVVGDVAGNAARIEAAVRDAAARGAGLCVTPELAICGYPPRDLLLRRDFVPGCRKALEALALRLKDGPPVLVGAPVPNPTPVGNRLHNAAVLLHEGTVTVATRKVLLPTYDVFDERRYFEPGVNCGAVTVAGWRIGVTVCEDIWNDKTFWQEHRQYETDPVSDLALAGVDVIVNLSASPFTLGKQAVRERMLSRVASRYRVPVLYANQVGGNDDLLFAGKSVAFDAVGHLMARGRPFEEDTVLVDVAAGTGSICPDPAEPEAQVWHALVMGTRDYARKCGFTGAVLGLSGGVDSALVAAVAAEALGPGNVRVLLMPSPHSSEGSVTDALAVARNLGLSADAVHTVPIGPLMDGFDAALAPVFGALGRTVRDVTEENIQSRIRGNLLMAVSNKSGAVLLTTGNKSELAVGYCTIYGDMAGGLAVIADVPKTLVYRVCRWRNAQAGFDLIPTAILDKAPSAELRPDQKDTDSLPPYDVLDAILERSVVHHMDRNAVVAEGFDPAVVDNVLRLVRISEFKRRQAAPGLKVTDRAFGTGWRMPVASRLVLP
ncbi:NAD+ synthase [Nitratidesulfovibrio sp. HK-II]|uniref:NAD+ synthase n=1 Tax=Nitratidesulfovibrio sp. HK-II TaxID=2009266 RepID=UPI000E2F9F02|nr:NAD+ synthase [Nitratidesulfovibrio sp. HK-II]GBO95845.1 NAD synthetase [Nitratidesulfovibrio sp. HK-II]